MILTQYEVERYIAATAKRADLHVNWLDPNPDGTVREVSTNGKVINLPRITMQTTQEQAEDLIGFVAHEVGHILHSDFRYLTDKGMDPQHSLLGALANIVEDDGVDAINSREFFGDRLIRNETTGRSLKGITGQLKKIKKEQGELPPQIEAIATMLAWSTDTTSDHYSNAALFTNDIEETLGTQGKEWLKRLRAGDYADRMRAIRADETRGRTEHAYEVARRIFEEVFEQNAAEEEKRCKERLEKEKREGRDGEGKDGDGKQKGRKYEMGKGNKEERDGDFANFDYRPFMEDQHDEFMKSVTVTKGSHINYENYKPKDIYHNYTPTPLLSTIIIDYPKGTSNYSRISPNESYDRGHKRMYEDEIGRHHTSDGFANKVRMLLQIRSKGKMQYGTKKGQLHQGNVYRVVLKDAPGYNERVFKRRIESDVLDTAVLVLGDISGSMNGQKMGHQIVGFRLLNDSIGNALRIPLQMMGFTEHECRNAMFIYRKFDDQQVSADKLSARMIHSSNYMNQNCDGDSIMFAYNLLKQRKEKRKVLIVTSDGSPASSKGGDVYTYTKKVIEEIEKRKEVDLIAIGIMDRNVTTLYKQHRTIKSASELEPALLSIIERKIV